MINVTNILFVSHSDITKKNEEMLYGINLGLALYTMLGISLGFGLSSSLDTFCTNSHGAKLHYLTGCYRNRAIVVLTFVFIPTALILLFLEQFLIAVGQDELVAYHAGNFVKGLIPGMLFFYWADVNRRFLLAQGIFIPPIFMVLVSSILHPLWVYIFFNALDMGAFGNGLSCSITNLLNYVFLLLILKKYSNKDALFFINKDSFVGFKEFFSIAIPSMLMLCLESWNYQIINFMVGYLDDLLQENVNSFTISFSSMMYMFPFGLSVSSANTIGQLVGDYEPKKTQVATKCIVIFTTIFALIIAIFLCAFKNLAPYIFTSKEKEVELMQNLLWIYLFYNVNDVFNNSYAGIFRGLGMQKTISVVNFICYYIVSLPLTYLLVFECGYGVYGVWSAYVVTIYLMLFSYIFIHLKYVDYDKICEEANKRLSTDTFVVSANASVSRKESTE